MKTIFALLPLALAVTDDSNVVVDQGWQLGTKQSFAPGAGCQDWGFSGGQYTTTYVDYTCSNDGTEITRKEYSDSDCTTLISTLSSSDSQTDIVSFDCNGVDSYGKVEYYVRLFEQSDLSLACLDDGGATTFSGKMALPLNVCNYYDHLNAYVKLDCGASTGVLARYSDDACTQSIDDYSVGNGCKYIGQYDVTISGTDLQPYVYMKQTECVIDGNDVTQEPSTTDSGSYTTTDTVTTDADDVCPGEIKILNNGKKYCCREKKCNDDGTTTNIQSGNGRKCVPWPRNTNYQAAYDKDDNCQPKTTVAPVTTSDPEDIEITFYWNFYAEYAWLKDNEIIESLLSATALVFNTDIGTALGIDAVDGGILAYRANCDSDTSQGITVDDMLDNNCDNLGTSLMFCDGGLVGIAGKVTLVVSADIWELVLQVAEVAQQLPDDFVVAIAEEAVQYTNGCGFSNILFDRLLIDIPSLDCEVDITLDGVTTNNGCEEFGTNSGFEYKLMFVFAIILVAIFVN